MLGSNVTASSSRRRRNEPESSTTAWHQFEGIELVTVLWILLAILYVACWIYFGLATFRKGHYWLFWIGFFLPFLWIIGALIAPTEHAAARAAGTA
jgi:hypothetical protein